MIVEHPYAAVNQVSVVVLILFGTSYSLGIEHIPPTFFPAIEGSSRLRQVLEGSSERRQTLS